MSQDGHAGLRNPFSVRQRQSRRAAGRGIGSWNLEGETDTRLRPLLTAVLRSEVRPSTRRSPSGRAQVTPGRNSRNGLGVDRCDLPAQKVGRAWGQGAGRVAAAAATAAQERLKQKVRDKGGSRGQQTAVHIWYSKTHTLNLEGFLLFTCWLDDLKLL